MAVLMPMASRCILNRRPRHHRLNQLHHPLTHIAIQGVFRRERDDVVLPKLVFNLEIRLAHLCEGIGIVATGDDEAVVVLQDYERYLRQVGTKHALAADMKTVAIDQTETGGTENMTTYATGDRAPDRQLVPLQYIAWRVLRVFG